LPGQSEYFHKRNVDQGIQIPKLNLFLVPQRLLAVKKLERLEKKMYSNNESSLKPDKNNKTHQ